jgi:hypothetical protein
MALKTMEYIGEPLTFERQLSASTDAVRSISEGTYKITNQMIGFTAGGTYEPQVGDVIYGATSLAIATITKIVLDPVTPGTWGGNDAAGIFYLHNQVGTFHSSAETLKIIKAADGSADAAVATSVAGNSSVADKKVRQTRTAKAMLVEVLLNPINYCVDGTPPTIDADSILPGRGINAVANTNFILEDIRSIINFKWINGTGSAHAQVRFQGFFD